MKKVTILFFLFFGIVTAYAQDIATTTSSGMVYLYVNEPEVDVSKYKRGSYSGEHILGEEIDKLLHQFEQNYVYYKKGEGAYAVEEKNVLKPSIYKAINRVIKHNTKQYSKGRMEAEEARVNILNALEVGNKLIRFNTEKVEYDLKNAKGADFISNYLNRIRFQE